MNPAVPVTTEHLWGAGELSGGQLTGWHMCSLQSCTFSPQRLAAFPSVLTLCLLPSLSKGQSYGSTWHIWNRFPLIRRSANHPTSDIVGCYQPRGQDELVALNDSLNEKD